ncbi:hypothetical protein MBH78_21840 [Oceanimonas sp. NS1]|nr:hypothetical protein [Oceanimonas sp. NS1]
MENTPHDHPVQTPARLAGRVAGAGALALTLLYRVVPVPVTPLMVIRLFEGESLKKTGNPPRASQTS